MLKKCLAVAMTLVAQVAFAAIGDSTKFDQDKFERIGDTLYYKISTAEQFEKLLEGVRIETDGYVVGLIEKDLVMGSEILAVLYQLGVLRLQPACFCGIQPRDGS